MALGWRSEQGEELVRLEWNSEGTAYTKGLERCTGEDGRRPGRGGWHKMSLVKLAQEGQIRVLLADVFGFHFMCEGNDWQACEGPEQERGSQDATSDCQLYNDGILLSCPRLCPRG